MEREMELEYKYGATVGTIKEIGKMENQMDLEDTFKKMEKLMKVNGRINMQKVSVFFIKLKAGLNRVNGKMIF